VFKLTPASGHGKEDRLDVQASIGLRSGAEREMKSAGTS